jgi:transmembrane sensor
MADDLEWEAVIRVLGGRSDDVERARVEAWLASGDRTRAVDEAMRAIAAEPSALFQSFDADDAAARLVRRMRRPPLTAPSRFHVPRRSGTMRAVAIAASILVAVTGVVMWRELREETRAREWVEMTTGRGETRELSFPSGTRVVLAPMSVMRLPRGQSSPAEVELEGEAFVELGAGQKRPFVLRTRGAEIVDRGTAFVAREYATDSVVQVAVVHGRVEVRSGVTSAKRRGRSVVAGEIARAPRGLDSVVVERGNVERELAWMRGTLVFDNESVREVALTLERWLDVEVRIADGALAERRFTGRLRTRNVQEIADILAAALDARVQDSGRVLTITTK